MKASLENKFTAALQDFIAEGEGDYIGLFQIIGRVSQIADLDMRSLATDDNEKLLKATLAFIILMLNNGFEAVDLLKNGKYIAWADQTPEGVCAKIASAWQRVAGNVRLIGFEFWFNKISKSRSRHR